MGRKLSSSEASKVDFARSKRGSYNWAEWMDGETYELVQGVDFHCSIPTFRVQWSKNCGQQGMSGNTKIEEKGGKVTLYIRAVQRDSNAAKRGPKKKVAPKKVEAKATKPAKKVARKAKAVTV
jgi:hypothetical protein